MEANLRSETISAFELVVTHKVGIEEDNENKNFKMTIDVLINAQF